VEACVRFPYGSDRKSYLNDKVYFLFIHKLKFQIGISKHVSLLYTAQIFDPWTWAVWPCMSSLASH